jgi:hypothetical protein
LIPATDNAANLEAKSELSIKVYNIELNDNNKDQMKVITAVCGVILIAAFAERK